MAVAVPFDGEKNGCSHRASVDFKGRRFALVSQSMHAPVESCLQHVGSMSCAQQPARDSAMCYSKQAELATIHPMHF